MFTSNQIASYAFYFPANGSLIDLARS